MKTKVIGGFFTKVIRDKKNVVKEVFVEDIPNCNRSEKKNKLFRYFGWIEW